ncbi:hypothetical protein RND81_11G224800 [Saponaria officinalis]|uniref:Trafficking protein particle complex subunit 12 n=1 Tax=Saponaria officinalis TaxID=3572 RepID=A0AAW1HQD3_SAPOF
MDSSTHHHLTTATTTASDPLLQPSTLISADIQSLQSLALRGSWRSILDTTEKSLSLPSNHHLHPHHHLILLNFSAVALSKLRRYADALTLIESSISDFDSPSHRFESYPQLYPSAVGSMIPFALRWLHAVLPSFVGRRSDSIDRLYVLLSFARSRDGGAWRRRVDLVSSTIISCHCSQKEYLVCVGLLNDLISRDEHNVELISKLGYVELQFGDIEGAKLTFSRVEKLVSENDVEGGRNLVGRNKALVYLVGKDYVSAVREYDECIERDDFDVVAINNKALCLMYLRDLSDSIKVLESSLERVPTVALNETLVVNLCSMYELAYVNHTDIKRTLSNWIARLAPDDFDSSCTRV